MGKLLDLKLQIDHRLLSLVNTWRTMQAIKLSSIQKKALKQTAEKFQKTASGNKVLICGNGPSLEELTFSDFNSTPTIVANYFYKHPKAQELNPEYYVIIDSKIMSGVWPVTMIDEIFAKLPNTELFLDVRWLGHPLLEPYKNHKNINWLYPALFPHAYLTPRKNLRAPLCTLNVVACAIGLATAIGYKKLGIAGVDGDGLFREILDKPSHFYEGDKDISMDSFNSMVKSLVLSAENLWAWQGIVHTHAKEGIQMMNLCKGGIMDCMPRVFPINFINK